jgi:hypothetical protein
MNNKIILPRLTRRNVLKSTAATAAFWAGHGSAFKALAATYGPNAGNQPKPSGSITQVPMTVSSTTNGEITKNFTGLAYQKEKILGTLFSGGDKSLIDVFKLLPPSVLRVGGSTTDEIVWTPNGPGGQSGKVAPADIDNLAAFLKAIDWKCIYGINLAGAATGKTNPALAGEEALYVGQKLGSLLASVEIGNEPDLYGRPGNVFGNDDWSLDKFISLWEEYRTAIVHKAPGVPISGPADAGDPTTWTIPFGKAATRDKINLLTEHYYVCAASSSKATVTELLDLGLHKDVIELLAELKAGADEIGVPFRINETGDFYSSSSTPQNPNVAGSYTAALWALDYMFMCAQGGAQGVNFESGGDVSSYVPILNTADSVSGIAPDFYGILLFTMAGIGPVLETVVSPGSLNITGYAVRKSTGGYSIIVLNKESSGNIQLQLDLPEDVNLVTLKEMTQRSAGASGPNVMATSGVTIQGSEVSNDGSFAPDAAYQLTPDGSKVTCYVPPLSAVLIEAS